MFRIGSGNRGGEPGQQRLFIVAGTDVDAEQVTELMDPAISVGNTLTNLLLIAAVRLLKDWMNRRQPQRMTDTRERDAPELT